jgi:ATP-binding cassette subfamily B protein
MATLVAPWPLKVIIDRVITGAAPGLLGSWGLSAEGVVLSMTALALLSATVAALANAREKILSATIRERLTIDLRDRLLGHLQTLAPTFRNDNRSGELVLRLVDDSDLFIRVLTKTLPMLFQQLATVLFTVAIMFWMDLRSGLLALVLVPCFSLVCRHYSVELWAASRRKRRKEGKVSGLAQEIVRGMPVIQALGNENVARERFQKTNRTRLTAGVEETRVAVRMEQVLQVIQGLALALTTGIGAFLTLRHQLTIGELTIFTYYMAQLLKPIEKLNDVAETLGRGIAGGERLLSLLEQDALVKDSPTASALKDTRGMVEFRNVWFEYPEHQKLRGSVLRGINLTLEPGKFTVLSGESGAGKSTILSLLVRLFDPTTGEIFIDGTPLKEITIESLRSQVAFMTQELHLFSGSIRNVLSPSNAKLEDNKLWDALAQVALRDYVECLPDRLDTQLGEDGLNLSGGQRQRLSLARAFLLERPLLLLDEPLANVDSASAAVILDAISRLRVGKTCLAITHETMLLDYADVVYRIEGGRITHVSSASRFETVRRFA